MPDSYRIIESPHGLGIRFRLAEVVSGGEEMASIEAYANAVVFDDQFAQARNLLKRAAQVRPLSCRMFQQCHHAEMGQISVNAVECLASALDSIIDPFAHVRAGVQD